MQKKKNGGASCHLCNILFLEPSQIILVTLGHLLVDTKKECLATQGCFTFVCEQDKNKKF